MMVENDVPDFINIGAGAGTSALALAEARPEASIVTIDISPGGPLGGLEGERNAFDDANMLYPTQILADSKEIGITWPFDVDLVFVDGDHSREGIRGDIKAWLPKIKVGGFMVFHDYENTKWSDVKPAVDELMAGHELIGKSHRIVAFRIKDVK